MGSILGYTRTKVDQLLATYALLTDAVPMSVSTPLSGTQNGFAGTELTAAHGDHRHPLPVLPDPSVLGPAGQWVNPYTDQATTSMGIGWINWYPYWLSRSSNAPIIADQIGVNVTTAGSADATLRVGFYTHDPTTARPSTQIMTATFAAGTLNTTGAKTLALGASYTFPTSPWFGWVAVMTLGTTTAQFKAPGIRELRPMIWESPTNLRGGVYLNGQSALPSPATTFTGFDNQPGATIWLRMA